MDKYLGLAFFFVWIVFFFYVIFKYGDDKTSPRLTIDLTRRPKKPSKPRFGSGE
jgi:hypothetical protein